MSMKILTIDGDYFGHRTIHGLRIMHPNLTLGTDGDIRLFENELNNQLIGLLDIFTDVVQNVVLVFDSHSWRKKTEPYHPYYIPQDDVETPLGYKANRTAIKEKDDIDYEMFRHCLNEFAKRISDKVTVFQIDGLEGDDLLLLLSRRLGKENCENVIFCSDGDLTQIVNNKTHVFRNNKSKNSPEGEVYVSKDVYKNIYNQNQTMSVADMFLQSSFENDFAKKLITLKLDPKYKYTAKREPGKQVHYSQPLRIAFIKSITGDKKDNIFPILRWPSTTGTRNYSVTEKMILKVFQELGYNEITDNTIKELMNNSDDFRTFFINLVFETKQNGIAKNILKHFDHNWKINTLSEKNIPVDLVTNFDFEWLQKKEQLLSFTGELMSLSSVGRVNDSASNILLNSTPGGISAADEILNWKNTTVETQTNNLPNGGR